MCESGTAAVPFAVRAIGCDSLLGLIASCLFRDGAACSLFLPFSV